MKVGFQNLLFGLGSYKAGYAGDGAILTIAHLAGWGMLFGGVGVMVMSPKINPRGYEMEVNGRRRATIDHPNYLHDVDVVSERYLTSLSFMSLCVAMELFAIVYGSVHPYYYWDSHAISYGNRSGFHFDVTLSPKGKMVSHVLYTLTY